MQKLEDKKIYTYDKKEGFIEYDPQTYEYNGYTIDKLYQLFQTYKSKLEEKEEQIKAITKRVNDKGVNLHDNQLVKSKSVDWIHLKVKDGVVLRATRIDGDDVVVLPSVLVPTDVESGLYELNNGEIRKNTHKEEEVWSQPL